MDKRPLTTIGPDEGTTSASPVNGLAKASDHRKQQHHQQQYSEHSAAVANGRRFRGRDGRLLQQQQHQVDGVAQQQQGVVRQANLSNANNDAGKQTPMIGNRSNQFPMQQQQQSSKSPQPARQPNFSLQDSQIVMAEQKNPKVLGSIQSRSGASNGSININSTEISQSPKQHTSSNTLLIKPYNNTNNNNTHEEGPLIHTDKLNTSSQLLYVFHSPLARRASMQAETGNGPDNHRLSSSSSSSAFLPSRISILSAVGKRAIQEEEDDTRQQHHNQDNSRMMQTGSGHQQHNYTGPLVPRLVVLNLEVGSSTATLAWGLSLIPASPSDQDTLPSASNQFTTSRLLVTDDEGRTTKTTTSSDTRKKELLAQTARPIIRQQKQIVAAASNSSDSGVSGNNRQNETEVQVGPRAGLGLKAAARSAALPQNQDQKQQLLPLASAANNNIDGKTNQKTTPVAGGLNALRVKRDTIRVVPTLGRSPFDKGAISNKTSTTNTTTRPRYKKAMDRSSNGNEDGYESAGDENNEDELPDKREMVLTSSGNNTTVATTGVRQTIDSSSDLLRISTNNNEQQQQRPTTTTSRPSIQSLLTTTTIRPSSMAEQQQQQLGPDLPVSTRLQLSRVQTLPASNNRRPPMRPNVGAISSPLRIPSSETGSSGIDNNSNNLPKSEDALQSGASTRSQLPQESSSTTTSTSTSAAPTSSSLPPTMADVPTTATSSEHRRQQSRPTTSSLFMGARRRYMNKLASNLADTKVTNQSSTNQRATSPSIIRTPSVQLQRIPTVAPSTSTTTKTTTSASNELPTDLVTPSTPTTAGATSATSQKKPSLPVIGQQRAAKSLSEFTTSTTTSTTTDKPEVTTLVTTTEFSMSADLGTQTTKGIPSDSNFTSMQLESNIKSTQLPTASNYTNFISKSEATTYQPSSTLSNSNESKKRDEENLDEPRTASSPAAMTAIEKTVLINHVTTTNQPISDKKSITTATSTHAPEPLPAETSKWLIRLRRFATNEVDIVKVVVNNLRQFAQQQQQRPQQHPALRYILFKNLEPASAYEICIESASPNQQVEDKYKILDANHFLKCHDTSDVEINNSSDTSNSGSTIKRMDITTEKPSDSPLAMPLVHQDPPETSSDSTQEDTQAAKMKSLCKEFFTLPSNSVDKINYGQFESIDSKSSISNHNLIESSASSVVSRKVKAPTDNSFVDLSSNSNNTFALNENPAVNATTTTNLAGSTNLRRPKSLQNSLKSHMELLEINDLGSSLGGSREPSPGANMFEILASRNPQSTLNSRLSSLASSTTSSGTTPANHIEQSNINRSSSYGNHHTSPDSKMIPSLAPNQDYLTLSVLPIVGCVFALIFIVTLANIVLSAINCQSKLNSSRRRRANNRAIETSRLNASGLLVRDGETRQHALGSFYSSDNSDNSNTSQSRIVVVGKNHEPFTGASAYFELPDERHRPGSDLGHPADRMLGPHSPQGSGSGKLSTSSYLLSSASRFPLGPSFEGDEKHNADMVGLARKNYDNFINHIYNADLAETTMDTLNEQPVSRTQSSLGSQQQHHNSRGVSVTSNNHYHASKGHYHRHRRHPSRELDSYRLSDTSHGAIERSQGTLPPTNVVTVDNSNEGNGTSNKKQRLRYDKINPIYNMNGLQYTSPTRSRVRSPIGGVSSFGYTNKGVISEDNNARRHTVDDSQNITQLESSSASDEQCPLCEPEAQAIQSEQLEFDDDDGPQSCDGGENCGSENNSNQFSCCLDRQKQRFEKQQQQLERVMTRNGSLVPQPFINPTGPPRCGSPSCQAVSHDHDLLVAASGTKNGNQDVSLMTTNSDRSEPDTLFGSNNNNNNNGSKALARTRNDDANGSQEVDKPSDYFLFGEANLQEQGQTRTGGGHNTNNENNLPEQEQAPLPPPPPAPPTMADLKQTTVMKEGGNKTLVKLGTMSRAGNSATSTGGNNANETINKTDFNQRRNELASKLHLSGMALK